MKRLAIVFGLLVVAGSGALLVVPGGLFDHLAVWRWTGGGPDPWPTLERSELTVLLRPGQFALRADVAWSDVDGDALRFLLNEGLEVVEARDGQGTLGVTHGLGLDSRYHSEGRLVTVALRETPSDGRARLELFIAGDAAHGEDGPDWRGILLVDEHEVRFSEQTNWHPETPLSPDGPERRAAPYAVEVLAPKAWELFVSGTRLEPPGAPGDAAVGAALGRLADGGALEDAVRSVDPGGLRSWRAAADGPLHPNVVGGRRQRASVAVGDTRVVTLLRDENAGLGPAFAERGADVLAVLSEHFGVVPGGQLCVFEQTCRPSSSYNWAADGLVVFDRWALSDTVPVSKLAHEIGHLWWGMLTPASGPGERFLTEGAAEAAAWTYLDTSGRLPELRRALDGARREVHELVERGRSTALRDVGFGSPHYSPLAYLKGALVHRYLWGGLDGEQRATFFGALRERRPLTLEHWRDALRTVDPHLQVPWVDHAGDLTVRLGAVTYDAAARRLSVSIRGAPRGESPDFPPRARVGVRISGRGFSLDVPVDLAGDVTTRHVDLSAVRPWRPADAAEDLTLRGPLGEPVVQCVTLDPDGWLPLGVDGDPCHVLDGPRLVSSVPEPGAAVGFGGEELVVTFDRPLRPFDAERYRAQRSPVPTGVGVPRVLDVSWRDAGRTAVFRIRALEPGQEWALPLRGAVQGLDGALPVEPWLGWTTMPSDDVQPPRVVACDPPVGATGVSLGLSAVRITFDEVMGRGVGFDGSAVRALQADGFQLPEMDYGQWDDSGRVLTLPVTAPLEPGTTYKLPVGRPLKDLSGNRAAAFELSFTTGEATSG